jgi:hypothetical protein
MHILNIENIYCYIAEKVTNEQEIGVSLEQG